MKQQPKESPCTYFSILLRSGESVLNCSLDSIKEQFNTHEYCITQYFDKSKLHTDIDIQLKDAILTCSVNDENKCHIAYLNLEKPYEIEHYIRYCDRTYPYNHQYNKWITHYGYLYISFLIEKLHFVLTPKSAKINKLTNKRQA